MPENKSEFPKYSKIQVTEKDRILRMEYEAGQSVSVRFRSKEPSPTIAHSIDQEQDYTLWEACTPVEFATAYGEAVEGLANFIVTLKTQLDAQG